MKILMITPYFPYPLFSGGQTRSFNLIKNLAKNHQITLFSFIRSDEEKSYIKYLKPFCKKIAVFKRRPAWSVINVILSGLTWYPFLVVIYLSRGLRLTLQQELINKQYDLIHAETFYVMPNIPKTNIPTLLVEQTIEYQVYQHFVEQFKYFFLKPFLFLDVGKVKFWESYYWKRANKVVAVSEDDKAKMLKIIPNLDVDVVPNGVDTRSFSQVSFTKRNSCSYKPIILYVGNFRWLQNREAVEILIKEIWPQIKKELPKSKLWIVGRGIDTLKNLKREEIIFDETVTDIKTAYQKADLVLAPIKGPGGTRLKVLEAMASGCPVVTTPIGIEGIKARNGQEVLIGDSNQELVDLTLTILKKASLRKKIIENAQKFVRKEYDWLKITNRLEDIYQNVCR